MGNNKKNVLFLHGALGSAESFSPFIPPLEKFCNPITYTFKGHGNTLESNRPFSIEKFGEEVLLLLDEIGISSISIFGYSMGGYVGLWLATYYPEKVKSVQTLATKFNWNPEVSKKEASFLNPEKILEKIPTYAEKLKTLHGEKWKIVLEKTAEMMIHLGENPVINFEKTPSCPVLLCIGDSDKMVSLEETKNAHLNIPKSLLEIFPNTPHPLEQVNPETLTHSIFNFLNSVE